jgi:hypothetical protein
MEGAIQKIFQKSHTYFLNGPLEQLLIVSMFLSSTNSNNSNNNKRRRRNMGSNATKICLRFVDENSGTIPRRSQLQSLKSSTSSSMMSSLMSPSMMTSLKSPSLMTSLMSPLMPTSAESGREESDHDNVISLTYSVPAGLMRSLQESNQVRISNLHGGWGLYHTPNSLPYVHLWFCGSWLLWYLS